MRFHANENIESEVVDFLRAGGHDVAYAAELTPRAGDRTILEIATAERRIVLTSDKDFGELCFRRRLPATGVVLVRAKDATAAARVRLIDELLRSHGSRLEGAFTVVSERGVRVRPLARK